MSNETHFEVKVLTRFCKGCGLCVEVCEQGTLYIERTPNQYGVQPAAVHPGRDCTGCLKCATMCPDAAIEICRVLDEVLQKAGD